MPGESDLGYHVVRNKDKKVRRRRHHSGGHKKKKTVSQMISDLVLYDDDDYDKENDFDYDVNCIQNKPDLWMAAFDNPLDFIQYCRDRLDHERKLQEESRILEDEIAESIRKMNADSVKQIDLLNDFFKVQTMNDKLQEMIMEERTNCQHLVGVNDKIESQLQLLSRKYQAALLLGKVDEKSVHHLLERNPKAVRLTDKMASISEALKKCKLTAEADDVECKDPVVGFYRIKKLENELAEVKEAHKQEVKALKETLGLQEMKFQMMDQEYKQIFEEQTTKLEKTQHLLQKSLKENNKLRNDLTKKGDTYFGNVMKDLTTRSQKDSSHPSAPGFANVQSGKVEKSNVKTKDAEKRIRALQDEVKNKTVLLTECLKCLNAAEMKMKNLKARNTTSREKYKAEVKALQDMVDMYKRQFDKLSSRRAKDNEGFMADVDILRKMCNGFEKGIQRFARVFAEVQSEKPPGHASDQYNKIDELVQDQHPNRFKLWLRNSDPRISVMAMSIWSDYFRQKLEDLDCLREELREKDIEERGVNKDVPLPPVAKRPRPNPRATCVTPHAKRTQKETDLSSRGEQIPGPSRGTPLVNRSQKQMDLSIVGRGEPAELPQRGPSIDREVELMFRSMVEDSQSSSLEMSSPLTGSYHSSDAKIPSAKSKTKSTKTNKAVRPASSEYNAIPSTATRTFTTKKKSAKK